MHESTKIEEAEYFLERMEAEAADAKRFGFATSAFVSAARSVLQYALKEAEQKPGGKAWYDGEMAADRLLAFFKEQRDRTIHREPITTRRTVELGVRETIFAMEWSSVEIRDADGSVTRIENRPPMIVPQQPPEPSGSVSYKYSFVDWPGPEDVVQLSRAYLTHVRDLVTRGRNGGFIQG